MPHNILTGGQCIYGSRSGQCLSSNHGHLTGISGRHAEEQMRVKTLMIKPLRHQKPSSLMPRCHLQVSSAIDFRRQRNKLQHFRGLSLIALIPWGCCQGAAPTFYTQLLNPAAFGTSGHNGFQRTQTPKSAHQCCGYGGTLLQIC